MPICVLAVATETGSGKALLPVLFALADKGVEIRAFLSAGTLSLASQIQQPPLTESFGLISEKMSLQELIGTSTPDAVLVGTTALDSLERQVTTYARERHIPTLSVVDERYGYRRRFSDQSGDLHYLTDIIALMDEQCYTDAISEGLPASRLHVTGSPILSHLVYHASALAWDSDTAAHRPGPSWKQVIFISETFARDNGSSPGEHGRVGKFLGFTEETVRRDIAAVLREVGRPAVLVEKMHPADQQLPAERELSSDLFWRKVKGGNLWPLLLESDAVVGMRSMALLEAGLLGCRTASYQPNLIGDNRCAAVRFGVAERLKTAQDLKTWLAASLSARTRFVSPPKDLPFIRPDATERLAGLVLEACRKR